MVDLSDTPSLAILESVSAKIGMMLYDLPFTSLPDIEFITQYGHYTDPWADTWLRDLHGYSVRREYPPLTFVHRWRYEMKAEWAMTLKEHANDFGYFMPLWSRFCKRDSLTFRTINPHYFVKPLILPGRMMLIEGNKDAGKSDFSLLMLQQVDALWEDYVRRSKTDRAGSDLAVMMKEHQQEILGIAKGTASGKNRAKLGLIYAFDDDGTPKGPRYVSNIDFRNSPLCGERCDLIARLSDFCIALAKNAEAGHSNYFNLDEMGVYFNKKRVMSRESIGIENVFRFTRKLDASGSLSTQNVENDFSKYLADPKRNGAQAMISKIGQTVAICKVENVSMLNQTKVVDIPPADILYQTGGFASFTVDINPSLVIEEVELEKMAARQKHLDWPIKENYRALVRAVERNRNPTLVAKNQALKQAILAYLGSVNPATAAVYTEEEIAEETHQSVAVVQEVMKSIGPAKVPKPDIKDYYQKVVKAILVHTKDVALTAELTGQKPEFVKKVNESLGEEAV